MQQQYMQQQYMQQQYTVLAGLMWQRGFAPGIDGTDEGRTVPDLDLRLCWR